NPTRLKSLMHIKVLETLLFAETKQSHALNQYSVITMQKSFATEKILIEYQKKLPHTAHLADILFAGDQSPNEEVFADWQDFLLSLETSITEKKVPMEKILQLKEILFALEKTDSLPVFMTLFFKPSKADNSVTSLDNILNLLSKKDEKVIQDLLKYQKNTKSILGRLDDFANPDKFKKVFNELKKHALNLYNEKAFDGLLTKQNWEKASPVSKNIVIKAMNDLVDVYDRAIKTMKASQNLDDALKVEMFKKMLISYFEFFSYVIENLVDEAPFPAAIDRFNSVKRDLQKKSNPRPSQLYPSAGFDVSRSLLDYPNYGYNYPATLEDMFTYIHQNHLLISAWFSSKLIDKDLFESSIPKSFIDIINSLKQEKENHEPKRVGVDIKQNQIVVKYNIPLRTHSSSLVFIYDRKAKTTTIEASFYGGNEQNRWDILKEGSEFMDHLKIISLENPVKLGPLSVTANWKIDPQNKQNNLEVLSGFYKNFIDYTFQKSLMFVLMDNIVKTFEDILNKKTLFQLYNLFYSYPSFMPEEEVQFLREKIRRTDDNVLLEIIENSEERLLKNPEKLNFKLLILLYEEGKHKNKILEFSKKILLNNSIARGIQSQVFFFFTSEIHPDDHLKDCIDIATIVMNDDNSSIQSLGSSFFVNFIRHKLDLDFALKFVRWALKSNNDYIRMQGSSAIRTILEPSKMFNERIEEQGKMLSDLIEMAVEGFFYDLGIEDDLYSVIKKLIAPRHVFLDKYIESLAECVIKFPAHRGVVFFIDLIREGKGIDKIIEFATRCTSHENHLVQEVGMKLFSELMRRNHKGYDEAIEGAKNVIINEKLSVLQRFTPCLLYLEATINKAIKYLSDSI
ncbi:MAG: hypothetical protein K1060chlam3_00797, partial [Candidatus Anoxychlamydiales bacterium]|nr:hypothetical protein [Candidatus Anoxychlamydiales bacterium]